MKILVGNNGLGNPGGSETYAYALIKELVSRGIDVHAVGRIGPGIVSHQLNKLGVPCYFKSMTGKYDGLLLSHSTAINLARDCSGRRIQTCHGVYLKVEQPQKGVDTYVSISEEVLGYLQNQRIPSRIIRNGIDCVRFSPKIPIGQKPKTVLSLAHSDAANSIIRQACKQVGLQLIERNKYKDPIWEMEDLINEADIVIGLGRGVYEAMACGRNVIIFDHRPYMDKAVGDGFVTENNMWKFLRANCSGRFTKREFTVLDLVKELQKYSQATGFELRKFAASHLNIKDKVDQYLSLLEKA